jgi:hypothetical protein
MPTTACPQKKSRTLARLYPLKSISPRQPQLKVHFDATVEVLLRGR